MSVNTHTSSDYDEDVNLQETEANRAVATAAESEVFLRDILGIHLPANLQSLDIAEKVAHRVTSIVDQTRSSINRGDLQDLLNRNIQARLETAAITPAEAGTLSTATDTQRNRNIRAVVEAIRESVPTAAMNDVLRYGLPAVIPEKQDTPLHHLEIKCEIGGANRTVLIDTRHSFWRDNEYDPSTPQLFNAIEAEKTLSAIGIRVLGSPPIAESDVLTLPDIANIVAAKSPVVDLNQRYDDIEGSITVNSESVKVYINLRGLLSYRDRNGKLVASYLAPGAVLPPPLLGELGTLLQSDGDIGNFITLDPDVSPVPPSQIAEIEKMVVQHLAVAPGAVLAIQNRNIVDLQKEIAEQHRYHASMREGSDNHMAAAFASSILMKYKDIRSVLDVGDSAKLKNDLKEERAKQSLIKVLKDAEEFNLNPSCDWKEADDRIGDYGTAMSNCAIGSANSPKLGTLDYGKKVTTRDEASIAISWVQTQYKEAKEAEEVCVKMSNYIEKIARLAKDAGAPGSLEIYTKYVDHGSCEFDIAKKSEIKKGFKIATSLNKDEIISELALTTEEEHKKKADEYKEELKKIEDNEGPKGAEAQHLVIAEYLKKYHGQTDAEARAGANIIRGRSLIDTEMTRAMEEISADLYGDVDDNIADAEENDIRIFRRGGKRDLERIAQVAKATRIPVGENNIPNWSAGSYKNLMGAYFALRQMNEGGAGMPWMMRLGGSNAARKQMREITRVILKTHAKAMLQEFGASVGVKDDEQKKVLKDPTKPEHQAILTQILEGEVPEHQKSQVQKILNTADKKLFGIRRKVGYVAGSMLYGDRNLVSGKNLLYGNKYFSALGAAKGVKNVGVGAKKTLTGTIAGLWNNKSTLAKIGLLTAVGGPVGLAVGTAVWGGDVGKGSNSNTTLAA